MDKAAELGKQKREIRRTGGSIMLLVELSYEKRQPFSPSSPVNLSIWFALPPKLTNSFITSVHVN
jgi:hypothetical protein